ncbi:hypothetical protein NM208_g6369 [Fusarium decemcellulare]|uniref:Uncharacterized protein n=1 Tax=Fusarium decemcellulare TaxID=57161 RepID=A0ACC1SDC3_9HYPO|nr:hypothetical protein NM208_g6369 [Fusarium decemcellulare]
MPRYRHLNSHNRDGSTEHQSRIDRGRSVFLDGMRGLAALCVFVEHFAFPFQPSLAYAYDGKVHRSPFQLPIFRLFYSGSPMVCIFFVISGVALSSKPVKLIESKQWATFNREMESAIFRRGIRLFGPTLVASFSIMGDPYMRPVFWNTQPRFVPGLWNQTSQWIEFVRQNVLLPSTWQDVPKKGHDVEYGYQLWTIPIEFWSSILLFATLLGSARLLSPYRLLLFATLVVFSLWLGRWDVALFYYGSAIARFLPLSGDVQRSYLGMFASRFPLYFGRISFALYITHVPTLSSFGWYLEQTFQERFDTEGELWNSLALILGFLPTFVISIALAEGYHRLIDVSFIKLARITEEFLTDWRGDFLDIVAVELLQPDVEQIV